MAKSKQSVSELTYDQAAMLIRTGRFVKVVFEKRTTGEERHMLCRSGVKKGLAGGSLAFDPKEKGLLVVWDAQKRHYRQIPVDGIKEVHCEGMIIEVGKVEKA